MNKKPFYCSSQKFASYFCKLITELYFTLKNYASESGLINIGIISKVEDSKIG